MAEIGFDQQTGRRVYIKRFPDNAVPRVFFLECDQTCNQVDLVPDQQTNDGVMLYWPSGWPSPDADFMARLLRVIRGS